MKTSWIKFNEDRQLLHSHKLMFRDSAILMVEYMATGLVNLAPYLHDAKYFVNRGYKRGKKVHPKECVQKHLIDSTISSESMLCVLTSLFHKVTTCAWEEWVYWHID